MTNLSDKVLSTINEQHICPKAKWKHLLRRFIIGSLFIWSLILGSISVAITWELISQSDWDLHDFLGLSHWQMLIFILPYIWLILLLGFLIGAYFNFRKTQHGYRYGSFIIIGISVVGSFLVGSGIYASGISKQIDKVLTKNVSSYEYVKHKPTDDLWFNPDKGLLVGKVENIEDNGEVLIKDDQGKEWIIKPENPKVNISKKKKGKNIKIIGKRNGEKEFEAKEVRSFYKFEDEDDDEDKD